MSYEETVSLGPEGIYPKIIMSSLQQLREEKFPWQYCIGLKTTHDVDAQRKLDNILKCIEEYPKLIQRIENILKNAHESDYELKMILQQLLKGEKK